MSSQLAERLGTEIPQIVHEPPDVASRATAEDTIDLANGYRVSDGERLSPSQELRLRNGMAQRADGSWAAKRVGDFGGRQGAGKTATVIARMLGGLFLVGEQLQIYTAHEFPTANEVFLRVGQVFEAWDDLSALVMHERKAHGDQGFELKGPKGHEITGKRRLLFKTRTGKSGRGFAKADLLVYDEAQHLKREQIAGSGPAKLANPRSQSWWSGSGGLEDSLPAWDMRREAILGTGGRLAYTEHTAETWVVENGKVVFAAVDPTDLDGWYRANPGLGRWVALEDMQDLAFELRELFPRECLCVWEPPLLDESERDIPMVVWADCLVEGSTIASNRAWALAVSPDRKWAALGLAGRTGDGRYQVEIMGNAEGFNDHKPGTGWIVERCKQVYDKLKLPLRVHASGPERTLIKPLIEAGVAVEEVSTLDFGAATGQLIDAANSAALVHIGQAALTKALSGAEVRMTTEGVKTWDARGTVEISPLKAVTVALGGVPQEVKAPPQVWSWSLVGAEAR